MELFLKRFFTHNTADESSCVHSLDSSQKNSLEYTEDCFHWFTTHLVSNFSASSYNSHQKLIPLIIAEPLNHICCTAANHRLAFEVYWINLKEFQLLLSDKQSACFPGSSYCFHSFARARAASYCWNLAVTGSTMGRVTDGVGAWGSVWGEMHVLYSDQRQVHWLETFPHLSRLFWYHTL